MTFAKIVSDGSISGTSVTLADGHELRGLVSATWSHEAGGLPVIEAHIASTAIEAEGKLAFYAADPRDGGFREVQSIIFADGSEWRAP